MDGLNLYDEALLEKLKKWCEGISLHITGPNETVQLFQMTSDDLNDNPISLPLICLTRNAGYEILNINKKPLTFDGLTLEANLEKSVQLNAVPVKIAYQIDIITRYFDEADSLARNFIFNLINYPRVTIHIPYNDIDYQHESFVNMSNQITDNSATQLRIVPGQFTRLTIDINIEDAYLWDVKIRPNYSIDYCLETEEKITE